jgi:hypothetical protein
MENKDKTSEEGKREKRLNRLAGWATKHPEGFYSHVEKKITNVTKKDFNNFAKQVEEMAEKKKGQGQGWESYSKLLTRNAKGFKTFLRITAHDMDFYEIAERAGLTKHRITRIIDRWANIVYLLGTPAETLYSPKDKVSNALWDGEIKPNTIVPIRTMTDRSGNKYGVVVSYVNGKLTYFNKETNTALEIAGNIGDYERQVQDAIASLWAYYDPEGSLIVSSLQIYRTITQNPKAKLTKKAAKAIETAMLNCKRGEITIITDPIGDQELWDRATQGKLKPEKKRYNVAPKYFGSILIFEAAASGEFGGILDRWEIFKPPLLYRYSSDKKQVASTPIIAIQPKLNRSKDTVSIMGYLTRRIDTMKKNPKASRFILWANVYEIDGVTRGSDNPSTIQVKQSKTRAKTLKLLEECKEKGLIKGYEHEKKDGTHMKKNGRHWVYHAVEIL